MQTAHRDISQIQVLSTHLYAYYALFYFCSTNRFQEIGLDKKKKVPLA
jgi:hypothetical protein